LDRVIAFSLEIPSRREDEAVAALWELGTLGVEVQPKAGGKSVLLAYFGQEELSAAALEALLRRSVPFAATEAIAVPAVDWVARFREGFRAFDAGSFRIVPVWEHDQPGGPRVLRVDPGRAFGTGTHESTRLCLQLIEELARRAPLGHVLDIGAGTGLLAIAALRLGALGAIATDIDPEALASARLHARLNEVRLGLVLGDAARPFRREACDLLLANLTAPLLIENAAGLLSLFRRQAVFSGFLATELEEVRQGLTARGVRQQHAALGEWTALLLERERA
jgi:ribosomal protein L11 methyltransferase